MVDRAASVKERREMGAADILTKFEVAARGLLAIWNNGFGLNAGREDVGMKANIVRDAPWTVRESVRMDG